MSNPNNLNPYQQYQQGLPSSYDTRMQNAQAAGFGNDSVAYANARRAQAPKGYHWDEQTDTYTKNPGMSNWEKLGLVAGFAPMAIAAGPAIGGLFAGGGGPGAAGGSFANGGASLFAGGAPAAAAAPAGGSFAGGGAALFGPAATTAAKGGFMAGLSSPEAIGSIASGGLGFASAILNNKAQTKNANADRQLRTSENLAGATTDELHMQQQGAEDAIKASQMDPVAQARHMFRAAAMRNVATHGPSHIGPGFTSSYNFQPDAAQFLNDDVLAEAASRFYGAVGQANPWGITPDLAATGLGAAGAARQGGLDANIAASLQRITDLNKRRRADLLGGLDSSTGSSMQRRSDDYFSRKP